MVITPDPAPGQLRIRAMGMRKKSDLPQKTCAACGRPMIWRKRWAKVWDEVKYCSDRCRSARGKADLKPQPGRG